MRHHHSIVSSLGVLCLTAPLLACTSLSSDPAGEPQPGLAKFALSRADSVRWVGTDDCGTFDLRTGLEGADALIKVEGEVTHTCDGEAEHFEFVYRQHSKALAASSWTTAWRPLDANTAAILLENCSWESRPDPSTLVGQWWRANNTQAENTVLGYIDPARLASGTIPFGSDGHERVGEESIDGVDTVVFENGEARVWMLADRDDHRPLRVVHAADGADVRFSEWGVPFAAAIPEGLRDLSEVCEVQ